MALTINTNVSSLNAQRNLSKSQGDLSRSMQRLSSGLRINSAKDDAAGLAISDRMTSQIRGLNQAARNSNDGISLAQTAEGALQESTNILQRMRELAIQSANDTNNATDRASLQSEINQLKQEMTRIATSTSFNGQNVLDGSLSDAQFQVGANANETISFSIASGKAQDLGIYALQTESTPIDSMPATTVTTFALSPSLVGDDTTSGNTVTAQKLTIENNVTDLTAELNVDPGMSAYSIADMVNTNLDAKATGWTATASTTAAISFSDVGLVTFTLQGLKGGFTFTNVDIADANDNTLIDLTALADAIEGHAATTGVTAELSIDKQSIVLTDIAGANIQVNEFSHSDNTQTMAVNSAALDSTDLTDSITIGGTVIFTGPGTQGVTSDQYDPVDPTAVGGDLTSQDYPADAAFGIETATGPVADTSGGNNVVEQRLTITGPDGDRPVEVEAQASAKTIAHAVNLESELTGVRADARTIATISELQTEGTIGFTLKGSNIEAIQISATVTADDLTALSTAINNQAGKTGITATLSGNKKSITLTQPQGDDIMIGDYTHSNNSAADTIMITGNEGDGVLLVGTTPTTGADSTVVGGNVSFYSTGPFNVESTAVGGSGSIFNSAADNANSSKLDSIESVDISTVDGAASAIKSIDGALSQIDSLRGGLGAIQNRFESTISNLMNVSENLTAARSRIMDADIAQETSAMTKNNILQQAGVAILSQANTTPQLALKLLQG